MHEAEKKPLNFIHEIVEEDLRTNRHGGRVVTRFPPEPNGYLHIGHAKAICLDFGTAQKYGGACHLRMDDTNPAKESMEYVEAIQQDIRWLGFQWGPHFYYAADYFERMYQVARDLIRKGKAYVCELSQEEWKDYRGAPTRPGRESPWRNRPAEESLDQFARMRAGEFDDGTLCLRAKIDMASPNLHLRDPVLYRILRVPHYRTGDAWCIYPTYDFAHPLEDAFENITHSLCTLEFEVHRPLYDWVIEQLDMGQPPRQHEFARLNVTYTVMSKRKLLELVQQKRVRHWDDPRLPTLCGMRRRGYPPEAIRNFCDEIGITKFESLTDFALLEHHVRAVLNRTAARRLAVLRPLKLVLENIPAGETRTVEAINNPEDPGAGTRTLSFGRELFIERDDFMESPPPKYFRLAPGRSVRLRYAGFATCTSAVMDPASGEVVELRGTWHPPSDQVKVKGTIHWVSAADAVPAEIRLYDRLFNVEQPDAAEGDFTAHLNPDSLHIREGYLEPSLAGGAPGACFQFERLGYFAVDPDARPDRPVFNRTATLKDTGAKFTEG
jgi:glutaminyl-tRNA synthetase